MPIFSLNKFIMKNENKTKTSAQENQLQTSVPKKRLPRKKKKLGKSGKIGG